MTVHVFSCPFGPGQLVKACELLSNRGCTGSDGPDWARVQWLCCRDSYVATGGVVQGLGY